MLQSMLLMPLLFGLKIRQWSGLIIYPLEKNKVYLKMLEKEQLPYQNSVYLKYNVFFDEVYCNHTEKVYFKYTISILGVYFNPCGQIA